MPGSLRPCPFTGARPFFVLALKLNSPSLQPKLIEFGGGLGAHSVHRLEGPDLRASSTPVLGCYVSRDLSGFYTAMRDQGGGIPSVPFSNWHGLRRALAPGAEARCSRASACKVPRSNVPRGQGIQRPPWGHLMPTRSAKAGAPWSESPVPKRRRCSSGAQQRSALLVPGSRSHSSGLSPQTIFLRR